jgi:hypothetical protein
MSDIRRRVKNVEKILNLNEEPVTVTIVQFGGVLPPDQVIGNTTTHYVMYDDMVKEQQESE